MNIRNAVIAVLAVLVLSAVAIVPALGGGWAVVSLDALPANVHAGEAFAVGFTVLQHGRTPLAGLDPKPIVEAVLAGTAQVVRVQASDEGAPGHYMAELTLPVDGNWEWTIDAFAGMAHPMPTLVVSRAVERAATAQPQAGAWAAAGVLALVCVGLALRRRYPAAGLALALAVVLAGAALVVARRDVESASPAEAASPAAVGKGADLFLAKGCVTCHVHESVPPSISYSLQFGPNLTKYRNDPAFIARWLADPAAIRKTEMPNLHLSTDEIEALVVFLNGADDS